LEDVLKTCGAKQVGLAAVAYFAIDEPAPPLGRVMGSWLFCG
jgi:hypothetical protein